MNTNQSYGKVQMYLYNKISTLVLSILDYKNENIDCNKINMILKKFVLNNIYAITDRDMIAATELYLLKEGKNGIALLYFRQMPLGLTDVLFAEVATFFDDQFLPLSQVLDKYLKFKSTLERLYTTYHFIMKVSPSVIAQYYIDTFGKIETEQCTDLASIAEEHCRIVFNQGKDPIKFAPMLTYYLIDYNNSFKSRDYVHFFSYVVKEVEQHYNILKTDIFEKRLLSSDSRNTITINDVDLMSGIEFEQFVSDLFSSMGYSCTITRASNDQGIDVIATRDTQTIGIQAKCYGSTVGNSAVQEAVAGQGFYKTDRAMVVTNGTFTKAAIELAEANNIILWDRFILTEKINLMN